MTELDKQIIQLENVIRGLILQVGKELEAQNESLISAMRDNIHQKEIMLTQLVHELAEKDKRILELENQLVICKTLSKEEFD